MSYLDAIKTQKDEPKCEETTTAEQNIIQETKEDEKAVFLDNNAMLVHQTTSFLLERYQDRGFMTSTKHSDIMDSIYRNVNLSKIEVDNENDDISDDDTEFLDIEFSK